MSQFCDLDRVDRAIRPSVESGTEVPEISQECRQVWLSEFCDKNYSEPKVPTLFENQTPLDADIAG